MTSPHGIKVYREIAFLRETSQLVRSARKQQLQCRPRSWPKKREAQRSYRSIDELLNAHRVMGNCCVVEEDVGR